MRAVLDRYPALREVCWVQEEPENMGAWEFVRPLLEELIGDRWPLRYIGRARNSSPSEGSSAWHQPISARSSSRRSISSRHASKRRRCCRSRCASCRPQSKSLRNSGTYTVCPNRRS